MTKLSRRSLFGAAAGAAVAGPAAIKSVLQPGTLMVGKNSALGMAVKEAYIGERTAEDPNWMSRRLQELISERATFIEKSTPPSGVGSEAARWSIDGLRSVSTAHRARMLDEHQWRKARERELSWMDERIADFRKQLGILGHFI